MFLLLQVMFFSVNAQFSLRGTVSGNGEKLAGASVVIENTFYGTSTDAYGNFSFNNLKAGDYKLKVSFIGYITKTQSVSVNGDKHISLNLTSDVVMADEVIVKATRAGEKSPFAWNNVSKEEITDRNMGQDIPYLMQLTPSFVTTSDAGAGVGYTNFRIRGTDLNRVNVTVNGIPLNDAESHGTWFVDQPDLASSLENIQIQRGVGTSTNGAAAFGATINLQTNTLHKEPYAKYSTAFGSFNTLKNTVSAGTGLINDNFTFDARLSKVSSDGFIDRASSDLKSFFVSGGYYSAKTIMKINVFSGFEETYQAWNGIPSVRLKNDLEGMKRYGEHGLYTPEETQAMIDADSRTYNLYTYKNQVDHYQQNHYQLFISHKFSNTLNVNLAGHFTHGEGYYENYKKEKKLADYLIPDIILEDQSIKRSDLINRKWLDNNFYGFTFSAIHKKNTREFTFGGGWNKYDGNHFGQVIWGQYLGKIDKNHEWYRGKGIKNDANLFAKYNVEVSKKINLFADMQFRTINYTITGIDDDLRNIAQEHKFNFFNPKLGIFYQPSTNQDVFASFAVAHREPNRANYVDADPNGKQAVQEILFDWEAGYTLKTRSVSAGAN
ncbi:MAG: TonB-dependent receptor, partial [Draconibacterium sp.]